MKTALYDWTKINTGIKISYTRKKFYNQFYFKLGLTIPGARLVAGSYRYLGDTIEERVAEYNVRSKHSSYYRFPLASLDLIKDFSEIYRNRDSTTKFRFESNNVGIYSNSEKYLYELAEKFSKWSSHITEISLIESPEAKKLLDQGLTIVKTEREHPYKVILRSGFINDTERQALRNYLKILGDEIKVTNYILERLGENIKYFHGGYLYVRDVKVVDLLRLISPNLIGPISQLVSQ